LLVGTYGNWAETAALSPITAAAHVALRQAVLVNAGFVMIGLAIISASVLLLWALRG